MFSRGQLIFAGFFLVAFVCLMLWSYAKDKKLHKIHYKNAAIKAGVAIVIISFVFIILRILIH